MKRFIIISFIVVVLLVGGLFVFALSNANSLIASYKPELERLAGDALGGKVTIGGIDATVFPSTRLSLQNLRVSSSQEGEPFTLRDIALDIKLAALLKGKLEISSLNILSPSVTIVKDAEGTWIAGLPRPQPAQPSGSKGVPSKETSTEASAAVSDSAPSAPLDFGLERFRLQGASVTFDDRVANKKYVTDQIDLETSVKLSGKDLLLPKLTASARAMGNIPLGLQGTNLALKGSHLQAEQLSVTAFGNAINLKVNYDLDSKAGNVSISGPGINLASLKPLTALADPSLSELDPKGTIGIEAKATLPGPTGYQSEGALSIAQVSARYKNFIVADLTGNISSTATVKNAEKNAQFGTKSLAFKLNGQPIVMAFNGTFSPPTLKIPDLTVSLFSGVLTAASELSLSAQQPFSSAFSVSGLHVGQALLAAGQKPEDQKFTATVESLKGNLAAPLKGTLPQALSGNAAVTLKNAEIKGINLAGTVLKALKSLPFVSGALYDAVPPAQKAELDSPNTALSKVTGTFTFSDGLIKTPDLKAFSTLFDLEADGTIGFNAEMNLNATILFNPTTSASLAAKVKELGSLLDEKGRLVVPLTLQGTAPKLTVIPNIDRLMKTGAKKLLQDKASDFLSKALGGNKGQSGGKKGLGGILGF